MEEREVTQLLRQLVRIQSPYFEEQNVMAFAYDWLRGNGVPVLRQCYYAEVADYHGENLYGKIQGGLDGPHIHLNGHLDTVRLCDGWTKEPYAADTEDGRLYGVGAVDMKGGCAAIMGALAALSERRSELHGCVSYSLVSDEEGPYGLGTTYFLSEGLLGRPDTVISCEPCGTFSGLSGATVGLGARGGVSFQVRFYGKASHAAEPRKGISAVEDAARAIPALSTGPKTTDPKLGSGDTCVVRVAGGGDACSVPSYCELDVFRHTVRGEDRDVVQAQTEEALRTAGLHGKWELVFRDPPRKGFDGGFPPYVVSEQNPALRKLLTQAEEVYGSAPSLCYMKSIGDFNLLGGVAGIPTVLFGPGGGNYHAPDEYVVLSDVENCFRTIVRTLL